MTLDRCHKTPDFFGGGDVPNRRGNFPRRLKIVWRDMIVRCEDPTRKDFEHYGGRGISVSPEFRVYRLFAEWAARLGWHHGLQLDRIDNDGPYSALNCRFVSPKENNRNRRVTLMFSDGTSLAEAAEKNGVDPLFAVRRVSDGWSLEAAALVPYGAVLPRCHSLQPFVAVSPVIAAKRLSSGWPARLALSAPAGLTRKKAILAVAGRIADGSASAADRAIAQEVVASALADLLPRPRLQNIALLK